MLMFARVVAVLFVVVGAANAFSWAPTWSARSARSALSMVGGGRLPFIAGNWKMNTELQSAVALASELADLTKDIDPKKVEMLVCPPYPFIRDVKMVRASVNATRVSRCLVRPRPASLTCFVCRGCSAVAPRVVALAPHHHHRRAGNGEEQHQGWRAELLLRAQGRVHGCRVGPDAQVGGLRLRARGPLGETQDLPGNGRGHQPRAGVRAATRHHTVRSSVALDVLPSSSFANPPVS